MSALRKAGTVLSNLANLTLSTSVVLQKEPMVAVVLLNWNNAHFTAPCIRSLQTSDYSNMHVMVVDNGSEDGSPEALRNDFPDATLIRNGQNLGFAAGNNVGIRAALEMGAEYVLILNNDTEVDSKLIGELVAACEGDRSIGISTAKMYFMNPSNVIWFAGSKVNLWTGSCKHVGYGETDHGQFDALTEPGFATGCCFLVRAELVKKLGGFEEGFFIYSPRTQTFPCAVGKPDTGSSLNPNAKLWHKESGTMAKNTRDGHRAKTTAQQHYLMARNGIYMIRRNASPAQKLVCYPICALRMSKRFIQRLLERDWESARATVRALVHGFGKGCPPLKEIGGPDI